MYTIDTIRYVLFKEHPLPEKYIVYARYSKKKKIHLLVTVPTKSSIALVRASDVGKLTSVITDVLINPNYVSFTQDIQPIIPWLSFDFSENNPIFLRTLISDSYIKNDQLFIPTIWCWRHFFHSVFHHLHLQYVNDEICVELKEWVSKNAFLNKKYANDCNTFFEDEDGPGVFDVEFIENDIYVKVLYIVQYTCR